ncbi:MAG: Gfo/Idh/MocA family oxidoreductase [Clostridia bacterium]|nr:Gfo/Idh/MocA family oxidoreductase [Clostridia bacterium]
MKRLKIGVFGTGRGGDLARNFMMLGCDIVAVCELNPNYRSGSAKWLSNGNIVKEFDNFDEFIKEDMDAVIIANFFHEHAPYAIKCFERGIHVFSECISNGTMAEGVELIRAFEKSNSIYMLAENYPGMLFNREIKRICDGGTLGKIMYAEGEYNHPFNPAEGHYEMNNVAKAKHWRNYYPSSYYVTHSIGPVMYATGATPKKVVSFAAFAPTEGDVPCASFTGDGVSIITTLNDDNSVFRVTGCAKFGGHHNSYRVCGTKGQIENLRGMGEQVMLRYNEWDIPEGREEINLYTPEWNDKDEELIKESGHGGGDFVTVRHFINCIREGRQPDHPFDIHSAVTMASVAILAHRSMLDGGISYDIPDFHLEEDRAKWENDRLTPFYGSDGSEPTLPSCSHTDFKPTEKQLELYNTGVEKHVFKV